MSMVVKNNHLMTDQNKLTHAKNCLAMPIQSYKQNDDTNSDCWLGSIYHSSIVNWLY